MIRRLLMLFVLLGAVAVAGYAGLRLLKKQDPMTEATRALEQGDPVRAATQLRRTVKADPRNVEAQVLLARVQLLLGDWVGAEKGIKIARALRYDRAALMPMLARSYVMQERYADVLAEIPANSSDPEERWQFLIFRSMAQVGLGDLGAAKASVDAAAAVKPDMPAVLLQQARVALMRKNAADADRYVARALEVEPDNVEALMLKADIQSQRWDIAGAVATLGLAAEYAPYSPLVRLARLPLLISAGLDKMAQVDLDALAASSPQDPAVIYYKAVLLFREKKYSDAEVEFGKLGPVIDAFPKANLYRGQGLLALNMTESGLESILRFVKLQPTDAEGARLAAQILMRLDRPDKAVALLKRGFAAGLRDAQSYDLLGRAHFTMGNIPDAVTAYRTAVALAPDNKEYASHLAAAQTRFGALPEQEQKPAAN